MSTTTANMKKLKVTDQYGNQYIMIPVDTEARQAIDEAKSLEFDEDFFTTEETDNEVNVGLNGVPFGVEDSTPLEIVQDDQEGLVIGSKSVFSENIAPAFDQTAQYAVGDVVTYNNRVYRCKTAISVPSTWDGSKWNETNISQSQKPVSVKPNNPLQVESNTPAGLVLRSDSIFKSSVAEEFSSSSTYALDSLVLHDNKVYICTTAVTSAGDWNSSNWTEYKIAHVPPKLSIISYNSITYSTIQSLVNQGKTVICYLPSSVTATDGVNSLPKGSILTLAFVGTHNYVFTLATYAKKLNTLEPTCGIFEASINDSDTWEMTFKSINGGLHQLGSQSVTLDGSHYVYEGPNNCNADLGHVDRQLKIIIKSSDAYHQAPNASFSFIIDRNSSDNPIIVSIDLTFKTETITKPLNLVCPGYIEGGSDSIALYSGTYGLHVMGDTAIVTVIDTDAP